eukprot:Gregarina_sp_Poly_1__7964@NODE_455_length_8267_cov_220_739024_g370_i0_p1_GENE_NODE_455_length_8267_cov_220_739024_g370_i0NODE_455_length_8267_cov_220_739024_g370_i0_p1_ORF_typecomplete_len955_score110_64PigN/PF04987_14/2_6e80Phosphodiest/PF01663_22/1_2e22Sulfatase/PF00884_23/6_5e10Metalloenzyme/PF01676_18/8_7e08SID1_RNA_chan/PF13965_6/45_NODE_455_length_8267_cov_220_739024_g370_i03803244
MSRESIVRWALFLLSSLILHCAFISSVFDAYFRTHLHVGMTPITTTAKAPADRIVVFVADGLRADTYFQPVPLEHRTRLSGENSEWAAPFLRKIAGESGLEAVGHTRAPTETRPCFNAMFAGFHEDPSAVLKAFKSVPVEFDHIFNHSRSTWIFGPGSTITMLENVDQARTKFNYRIIDKIHQDYSKPGRIHDERLAEDIYDVLRKVQEGDTETIASLEGDRVIILFHFLATDVSGHGFGPHSFEYFDAVRYNDELVEKIYSQLETHFKHDGRTTYLFTADHGMSDRGTHGDGETACTAVPFVAWGAGVKNISGYAEDLEQSSLTPLISTLLGAELPTNSRGYPPLQYFESRSLAADSLRTAALAQLEHYRVVDELLSRNKAFYLPFAMLTSDSSSVMRDPLSLQDQAALPRAYQQALNSLTSPEEIITLADRAFHLASEGLEYLQTYDRVSIILCFVMAYFGFIVYSVVFLLKAGSPPCSLKSSLWGTRWRKDINFIFGSLVLGVCGFQKLQSTSSAQVLYFLIAALIWWRLIANLDFIVDWWRLWGGRNTVASLCKHGLVLVLLMTCLTVLYRWRAGFALSFLILAAWPWVNLSSALSSQSQLLIRIKHRRTLTAWSIACVACAPFSLLSPENTESFGWMVTGGALLLCISIFVYQMAPCLFDHTTTSNGATSNTEERNEAIEVRKAWLLNIRFSSIATIASMAVAFCNIYTLQRYKSLSIINQALGWSVILVPMIIPLRCPRTTNEKLKLALVQLSLFGPYYFLSVSYESTFYLLFSALLMLWLELECIVFDAQKQELAEEEQKDLKFYIVGFKDLRIACIFIYLLNASVFSTGNVASLASFNLRSILRLQPVLSLSTMSAIVVFKLCIPLLLTGVTLVLIARKLQLRSLSLFVVSQAITDICAIIFFFQVRNTGSWAQIGQSLTLFVIGSMLGVLTLTVQFLSRLYVRGR